MNRFATTAFASAFCALVASCATPPATRQGLENVQHIVVVYMENRSFDNLYGLFPGADGIANATPDQYTQVDYDGTPLPHLPPVWKGKDPDPAFPKDLPNKPFRLDLAPINIPLTGYTRDLIHKFYPQQEQINGGRNNRFVEVSDAGALAMGYFDGSKLPMWKWAQEYVLADRFFMGAFGDSYLNHFWLICACTPVDAGPPTQRAQLDDRGWLKRKPESPRSALLGPADFVPGEFTIDGYSLSTNQPPYQPSRVPPAAGGDPRFADPSKPGFLPPQTQKTIGDTLSAKGISWAWYAGAWNAALKDGMQPPDAKRTVIYNAEKPAPYFVPHHQPFNYFASFAPGTAERERHLKDYTDLVAAIEKGELPAVAFYKPQGTLNQHPGFYADVMSGDVHIAQLIEKIKASALWSSTAIIVTYDENGGFWDHVPPPKGDRWGPGTRIPAIIVSPFAKRGYVDHTVYDTTSIIKFITRRFDLEPLPGARAGAGDLTNAFQF